MRNHTRTRTEQAYRAFKRQVIALAESTPLPAPIEKDAVMQTGSMVFAVWRSASELDGVGVLVIKGQLISARHHHGQPSAPAQQPRDRVPRLCRGLLASCRLSL